jgi:hypothetical protein
MRGITIKVCRLSCMFLSQLVRGSRSYLASLLFRWLAIPMIQDNLDRYTRIHNSSKPRRDPKKRTPTEIPDMIMEHPEEYGPYQDYKVCEQHHALQPE